MATKQPAKPGNLAELQRALTHHARNESVPFILPPNFPMFPTRMGTGVLVSVTAAANTDVTMTHNLARLPHFVVPLDNGTAYVPSWKWSTVTPRTTTTATGQFSIATSGAVIWIV